LARRINWFDVVGRALDLRGPRVGRIASAVERLSATFREGRHDFGYPQDDARAAYLVHLLPAHVCDLSRLLQDLPDQLDGRSEVRCLALGAGPGTEVLALLDAVCALRARGGLSDLRRLECARVDRVRDWDRSLARLLPPALELARMIDPTLGAPDGWRLDAPHQALVADLAQPLPGEVAQAVARADLILAANVLTEVPPRGTDALPDGLRACLEQVFAAAGRGAPTTLVFVDRGGAPGAAARLGQALEIGAELGAVVYGPRERKTRCACGLTRQIKAIYKAVNLPTTKDQDRPVLNCRTVWGQVSWPAS
jgi:hypothetical protein